MKNHILKKKKLLFMIICMLAAGICYSCTFPEQEKGVISLTEETGDPEENEEADRPDALEEEVSSAPHSLLEEKPVIYVHVCGQVNTPGVYGIPEGSRVYEAIEEAGGFLEDASRDFLNLAQLAEDGMKVEVPSITEAAQWEAEGLPKDDSSTKKSAQKVNLNRASREELMTLKGIGESRAEDIIRYREEFGGFNRIEDIMNVPGIKEGAFEKIREWIAV